MFFKKKRCEKVSFVFRGALWLWCLKYLGSRVIRRMQMVALMRVVVVAVESY